MAVRNFVVSNANAAILVIFCAMQKYAMKVRRARNPVQSLTRVDTAAQSVVQSLAGNAWFSKMTCVYPVAIASRPWNAGWPATSPSPRQGVGNEWCVNFLAAIIRWKCGAATILKSSSANKNVEAFFNANMGYALIHVPLAPLRAQGVAMIGAKNRATKTLLLALIDVNAPVTPLTTAVVVLQSVNYAAVIQIVVENAANFAFPVPNLVPGTVITRECAECRAVHLATDFHAIFVVRVSSIVAIVAPQFAGRYALLVDFVRFVDLSISERRLLLIILNIPPMIKSIWIKTQFSFFLVNISSRKVFWTEC